MPGTREETIEERGRFLHGDTSPVAESVQLEILRRMSGEQRVLLAFEMSMFARGLAEDGIRQRHPDWPETRVKRELLRLAFFPAPLPVALS